MNRKIILVVLVCFIHFQQLFSQQNSNQKPPASKQKDTSQILIAHWKKGETKTYSITHNKQSSENGKPTNTSLTYWATIKVMDSTAEGYTLQWNYILPPSGLNVPHTNEI